MRTQRNGLFPYIMIFILAFVALRFLPVLVRIAAAVATGVRAYWWAVLPVLVGGWTILKLKKRSQAAKKADDVFTDPSIRDVTNSLQ